MGHMHFVDDHPIRWAVSSAFEGMVGLSHGFTTRSGPDLGAVDPDRKEHAGMAAALAEERGLKKVAWARQVHGGTVTRVERGGFAGDADALYTDIPGLGVMARSADCPLILLAGRRQDGIIVTGVAHASWSSTLLGITMRLAANMGEQGVDPATMKAFIGPCAGPCCYEVGEDVLAEGKRWLGPRAAQFIREENGRLIFDLPAANRDQLTIVGVEQADIHESGVCTICSGEDFWSHRRQGEAAGRFGAIIGVRS